MKDNSVVSTKILSDALGDLKSIMVDLGTEAKLVAGQALMEQGETGETLYVVIEGDLEVSVLSSDGRRLALNLVHPGEILGEIALFDPGPHTATVTARGPCRVWGIKNADMMTALRTTPALAADLVRLAGQRMRWMGRQLNEQVFLPLPARLARKILHLTAHDDAKQPVLSLSQLELAEFAGASREAVSKTLTGWSNAGHIVLSRGSIKLLDNDALREISEITLF